MRRLSLLLADLWWLAWLFILGSIAGLVGLVESGLRSFGEGGKRKERAHV